MSGRHGSAKKKKEPAPAPRVSPAAGKKTGRHTLWRNANLYTCIRKGSTDFATERDISKLFEQGKIEDHHSYIFCHSDQRISRNGDIPKYEAAYRCNGLWLLVQKRYLDQAYANREGPAEDQNALTTDGVPLYVDRYIAKEQKKRETKARHEQQKKEARKRAREERENKTNVA